MKFDLIKIAQAAKQVGITGDDLQSLIERLQDEAEPQSEKTPAVKKQYVILVSDPQGFLIEKDFSGWVLQIPESEHPLTALERIQRSAYDYNASKKGRLMPVQTIGEACESVKPAFFKENDVWVKSKQAVLVVRTNNELPKAEKLCSGASEDNS
jgi:hypothetical protein